MRPCSNMSRKEFPSSGRIVASRFLQKKPLLFNQNVSDYFNRGKDEDSAGIQEMSVNRLLARTEIVRQPSSQDNQRALHFHLYTYSITLYIKKLLRCGNVSLSVSSPR